MTSRGKMTTSGRFWPLRLLSSNQDNPKTHYTDGNGGDGQCLEFQLVHHPRPTRNPGGFDTFTRGVPMTSTALNIRRTATVLSKDVKLNSQASSWWSSGTPGMENNRSKGPVEHRSDSENNSIEASRRYRGAVREAGVVFWAWIFASRRFVTIP